MRTIDYSKYEDMTKKQIAISLENAEKRIQILQENYRTKIKEQTQLINFLKAKMRESLNKPKDKFIPYTESESYKLAKEYEATLSDEQKKAAMERVESFTNRNYDSEL